MKRRRFVAGLACAAVAWPHVARGQAGTPVIGFLSSRSAAESADLVAAFREGIKETGHVEGENVHIAFRWADGDYARLGTLAAELVERRVSVIVPVGGKVTARAAQAATSSIPVVFVIGSDPVEMGLVASLNQPGGNTTGATLMAGAVGAKRLELLRELVPGVTLIGFLVNPAMSRPRYARRHVLRCC